MKVLKQLLVIHLLSTGVVSLHSQEVQLIDSLFYRSVNAYKAGHFRDALQNFEFMDRVYPGHRRATGSLLMQAKTLSKLDDQRRAIEVYDKLLKDHPSSVYADDALYGKAVSLYLSNNFEDAVRVLFQLLDHGGDTRLLHKAANLSSDIMDFRLDVHGLKRLYELVQDERGQAAITLRLVQRLMKEGQYQQCKDLLEGFSQKFPRSIYNVEIQQRLRQIDELSRGNLKLGVILPLTGDLSDPGKAVLSGIKYAIDKYNAKGSVKVELVVKDSRGEILPAIMAVKELCNEKDLVAIIGELESDQTAAVAAVAQERGVPLLAPAASAQGIADIGSYVFQMNPPLDIRANVLADYAIKGLGMKNFAILAEAGEYGRIMHDNFKNDVEQMGANVLIEKWYYSGDADLGMQFKAIRDFGLRKMFKDSVLIRVPKRQLNKQPPASGVIYVDKSVEDLVDSTALAVTAFDGMFLPVLHEDLQIVIAQFARYNFSAMALGGVPWDDSDLLEEQRRYIDTRYLDKIIFLSDYYVDPSNYEYNQFLTDYRLVMKRSPDKLDVFGYDAAQILLSTIGEKRPNRGGVAQALSHLENFPGIQGSISFNKDRINTAIHLMQFRGGRVVPIR